MATIAVLLSAYKGEKYIKEQIDSILAQKTVHSLTLIIREDGSKDGTEEIVRSVADPRVRYYRGENLGAARGFMQLLLDNPGYDYYAFADQDDYWYEDKLQRAVDRLSDAEGCALYCSNAELVDEELRPLGRNVHRYMHRYTPERVFLGLTGAQGCTCVFNRQLADRLREKGMPENILMHDSYVLCVCVALGAFFYADEWCSMKYRMHGNNVSGMQTRAQVGTFTMIKRRLSQIFVPGKSILPQIKYVRCAYEGEMPAERLRTADYILASEKSFFKRVHLAFSSVARAESRNLTLTYRAKILLGNY